jgi:DNA-binding response OmpR family regulator
MLQHFLSRDGYRVHIASDGRQALDFLELGARTGKLPDLVILDMYVTYSDGFQVLRTIGDELGPKQRVLMLSVQARDEDIVKAFELGAMDFVTKPFSIDVVRARVRNLLRCERIA